MFGLAANAFAATVTWDGSEDGSWKDPDNWSGGVAPISGDTVVFNAAATGTDATIMDIIGGLTNITILVNGDTGALASVTVNTDLGITGLNMTGALQDFQILAGTGVLSLSQATTITTIAGGHDVTITERIVNSGNLLTIAGAGAGTTISGGIAGTGGLTLNMDAAEVVTFDTVSPTYSGATTITSGVYETGAADMVSDVTDITIANDANAKLDLKFAETVKSIASGVAGLLDVDVSLVMTGDANKTMDGVIAGAGTVTKQGSGTLTLGATNTYTGITTVSEGTLVLNDADAYGANATATGMTLGDGTTLEVLAAIADFVPGITLTGNATIEIPTAGTDIDEDIDNGGYNLTITGGESVTLSGIISGAGGLTLNMDAVTDVVTLGGANTYTGITRINTGMLTTAIGAERIADTSPVNIAGSAANAGLTIGVSETIGSLSGSGNITMAGLTLTINQTTNTTYSGVIGVGGTAGVVTKNGTGKLTLTGTSLYTGDTTIGAGTLNIQNAAALGSDAGNTTVSAGATLELQGGVTVAAAEDLDISGDLVNVSGVNTYNGPITVSAATNIISSAGTLILTGTNDGGANLVFSGAGDTIVNGVIANGGGTITKNGTGTLTLNAANTIASLTTVNAGTLVMGGSIAGAVTANNAGTKVAGIGTITGNVIMNDDTILAPGGNEGDEIGTLSFGAILTFNDDSRYVITMSGGSIDKIDVAGHLVLGGGTTPAMVFQAGYNSSGLVLPVTIMNIGGTYADAMTNSLGTGYVVDTALVGTLIRLTAKPDMAPTDISVTPTQLPKGAYVNGPGGATDDNYFWQTIHYTFSTVVANGTITIDLPDGVHIANSDGDGSFTDEIAITWGTVDAVTFSVTAATADNFVITQAGLGAIAADDEFFAMFPVETDLNPGTITQDDYSFTFSADANQNIAHGDANAPSVTLVDANALSVVSFKTNMTGGDDSTAVMGAYYPDSAVNTYDALPDLVYDNGLTDRVASNLVADGGALDSNNDNDITYTVWVSTDSTLGHISDLQEGVTKVVNYETSSDYEENENGTGDSRLYTGGLPEGNYYVYITSDFTGDFPLARSGRLTVLHYPVLNIIGWDLDGDGLYDDAGLGDDADMTLDTGDLYNNLGAIPASAASVVEADLYVSVDDLDDNAEVTLYYSTNSNLSSSNIITSGTAPSVVVDSLAGAYELTGGLFENVEDSDGFISWTWNVDPDDPDSYSPPVGSFVAAGSYTIYAVANDGKNQSFLKAQGSDTADDETIKVRHSPNLTFDVLTEYNVEASDTGADADVTIVPSISDVVMISWGKAGAAGDTDPDDSCVIELYIDYADAQTGAADYAAEDYAALRTAAAGAESPTGTHKINNATLYEDPEGKADSYFAWNLKEDFERTGWLPNNQVIYHLYAIIDENDGGTARVVSLGGDGIVDTGEIITEIEFNSASTFARLADPPAKGVTINSDETYTFNFEAFDFDADGDVGIFIVESSELVGGAEGPSSATIAELEAAAGAAPGTVFCLTDDDGDYVAGGAWLSEDDDTSYDFTIRTPGDGGLKYTKDISANAVTDINGTYYVYIGVDNDNNDFVDGTETVYRSPGTITIVNSSVAAPQRNLALSPTKATVAQGDTLNYSIKSVDPGGNAVLMDFYVAVEKAYFDLVPTAATTPFTDATGFGTLIENSVIDDDANGRWVLHATVFNSGNPIAPATSGLGSEIASFQLVSKGTIEPIEELTAVSYLNEPGNGWVTGYTYSGENTTTVVNTFSSDVRIQPRAIVEGIVEFQGRSSMDLTVTFELRERDSYVATTDSVFIGTSDVDAETDGLQYTLDTDGKFTLLKVPSGEWDFVVIYDRYLAASQVIEVYPGVDDVFVDFGTLLGGDAAGYTDVNDAVNPDNEIDTEDLDQISDAYLKTSADPEWDDGVNNYKFSDIDESDKVDVTDLQLATSNLNEDGAQPIYKTAVQPDASNANSTFELVDVPSELIAGRTYTFKVNAANTADVRGYFVNLNYNPADLTFVEANKGDFIGANSYYFPTIGENTVGFTNAVYGHSIFSGDGTLAEFTFTANRNCSFSDNMLGLVEATVVNKEFLSESITIENPTVIESEIVAFDLNQNFPNPFNPTTTISFSIPKRSNVEVKVYNILGSHVKTLVSDVYDVGNYSIVWDATDINGNLVSNGMYFYTIRAEGYSATKKMMFLK